MFDNSSWDSSEFYRGYQAALNDMHFPETIREFNFKIMMKGRAGFGCVYAIRKEADKTYFLTCSHGRWEWIDSEECSPVRI